MNILQAFILGIVQGITEFIPVSSSGHLVIIPTLLNWDIPEKDAFIFDVLLQVATLVAVILYFKNDLQMIAKYTLAGIWQKTPFKHPQARLGWYLIVATFPAGIAFLIFDETFENAFSDPITTSLFLLVTAALLLIAEYLGRKVRSIDELNWKDALIIGIFQIFAIFPGISRSGSTIAGGMLRNLERDSAARFSFLISVPVMLAAGLIAILELINQPNVTLLLPTYMTGFFTAVIVGYISIRWLLRFLTKRNLSSFAFYCIIAGIMTFIYQIAFL